MSSGTAREAQIHRARPTRALGVAIGIAIASLLALGWLVLVGTPTLSIGVTHQPGDRWELRRLYVGRPCKYLEEMAGRR